MGFLDSASDFLFGEDPSKKANQYLEKIAPVVKEQYQPYIGYGREAYGNIAPIFQQMASDPTAFLNSLLEGYEPSRAYELSRDEAMKAAGAAAAAGGVRGSQDDIALQSRLTDALLGNDMQQWLNNIFNLQNTGLTGQSNIFNTGFNASSNLASDLANALGSQASAAFQGQAQQNANRQGLFTGLAGAAGGLAGLPIAGGGSVGGNFLSKYM